MILRPEVASRAVLIAELADLTRKAAPVIQSARALRSIESQQEPAEAPRPVEVVHRALQGIGQHKG